MMILGGLCLFCSAYMLCAHLTSRAHFRDSELCGDPFLIFLFGLMWPLVWFGEILCGLCLLFQKVRNVFRRHPSQPGSDAVSTSHPD